MTAIFTFLCSYQTLEKRAGVRQHLVICFVKIYYCVVERSVGARHAVKGTELGKGSHEARSASALRPRWRAESFQWKQWRHSQSWVCFGEVSPSGWVSIFTQSGFKQPVIWLNGTKNRSDQFSWAVLQLWRFLCVCRTRADGCQLHFLHVLTSLSWLQRTPLWVDITLCSFSQICSLSWSDWSRNICPVCVKDWRFLCECFYWTTRLTEKLDAWSSRQGLACLKPGLYFCIESAP